MLAVLAVLAGTAAAGATLDEARALHAAGRLDEALVAYDAVAEELSETDPGQASIARNNACVILMNRGDNRAAVETCREALRLLDTSDDPLRRSRTLNNLGLALQYLGEYDEAGKRFGEALELNRARGDVEGQVINHANLAVLAIQAGRYAEALAALGQVQSLAAAHAEAPWSAGQVRVARINQAVVLERLGAYREALDLYRRVLAQGGEEDRRSRAALLSNVGVVYRNLGDPQRASAAYEEAIRAFEEVGDRSGLANAWHNLALVRHLNLERLDEAEAAYRKALELAEESGDLAEELQIDVHLGRLLLERGRTDDAAASFTSALDAAQQSGSGEIGWMAREGLGRVAAARGDLQAALRELEQALTEIEAVRESLDATSMRSRYFGERRAVYAAAVDVLAQLDESEPGRGQADRALEIVQRAKARSLLDSLGAAGHAAAAPLGARELGDVVGGDLLLEYFAGERALYAWAVHGGGVRMAALGPAAPLLDDAGAVQAALARGDEPDAGAIERLSRALLGSLGELPQGVEAVHVAPDGRLFYLPFELLHPPSRPAARLVDEVAVDYLPSGSTLGWAHRGHDGAPLGFAGLGAPALPRTDGTTTPAALLAARFDLGELPAALPELLAIRDEMPGPADVRSGAEATEEGFAELGRRGARVLHVASHAVLDEASGTGAAILLTPGPGSDGVLRPSEIAALDLRVDLTVLSTCRSALDAAESGDALASLSGALLAAGSSAVLATLWDVDDEASRAFMEQLYHELGRGRRPAEALRRAKLRMIADPYWSNPSRWAAYVLVGRAEPVAPRIGTGTTVAVVAGAGLAVGLLWLALRRRRPT
jgi:tetratricopeptide (TPR) repeat protein